MHLHLYNYILCIQFQQYSSIYCFPFHTTSILYVLHNFVFVNRLYLFKGTAVYLLWKYMRYLYFFHYNQTTIIRILHFISSHERLSHLINHMISSHDCQCGLHAVLWSHIGSLMRFLDAEPRSTALPLFPSQCPSGTILLTPYSMVWDWRVSRAGPNIFLLA